LRQVVADSASPALASASERVMVHSIFLRYRSVMKAARESRHAIDFDQYWENYASAGL